MKLKRIRRIRKHVNPLAVRKEHRKFKGFKNKNPIFVDVGAYRGEFMNQLFQKFPDHNYILFELRTLAAQKLEQLYGNRENFAIFDGDAGRNWRSILEPSIKKGVKIKKIFINFPDPWFKEKHKKRRFINESFLREIATWMPTEIVFVFQTDQQFLFEEILEVLEGSPFNDIKFFEGSAYGIPTNWEQAKLNKGEKIWRMEFRKKPTSF